MLLKFIRGIIIDRKNGGKILEKHLFEIADILNCMVNCVEKRRKCMGCYYYDNKKDFCMHNSQNPRWSNGKDTLCNK